MAIPKAPPEAYVYTVNDFYALVPDGQKADLINGAIYMASPDSDRADELTNFIHFLMRGFAEVRDLGRVKGSRYAFILSETRAPEPDVAFVSRERQHIVEHRGATGAPDIAVEVVSRDSRSRDYNEKMRLYEEAGVREYWIVDTIQHRAEFYRLRDGRFELAPLARNHLFYSEALAGFWIDVNWLLADPLPAGMQCLQHILSGNPNHSSSAGQ